MQRRHFLQTGTALGAAGQSAVEQRAVDTARRLMAAHIGNAEERISASLRAAGYA